jgi:hypothetical protein
VIAVVSNDPTLDDLAETHVRFEKAVRALNFNDAQAAWLRIDVLLERLHNRGRADHAVA